jgi:predicted short-subunit dehydrogenase-like oxidoreductase (DUF2520 family)
MTTFRLIGVGRAGQAMTRALTDAGWTVVDRLGRDDDVRGAAAGVDVVLIATPDAAIAGVAAEVEPADAVLVHLAGSLGLDALAPHPPARRAAVHPLVALPNAEIGARRLAAGASFAIAGHPIAARIVDDLGGRAFVVADEDRAAYHAAAVIASNHVVALLGQVERVAAEAGVPLDAYLDLVRVTIDNVADLGPAEALTGPVARGDWVTVERHREVLARLDSDELPAYDALVALARRLVDRR